ncbi:MAG: FAD-dependent oxidoreductase, partial [Actinobacteria bacterium]|nr:FAD-dependent oxidoreductase [Actinomycetota bacterium]
VHVGAGGRTWSADRLVACAGLQSDRVARLAGLDIDFRIIPFRGEYFTVARTDLVHRMIYPVPDPDLPFLGVHLTPTVHGGLTVGPNAVLGLAREGYTRFAFNAKDAREIAGFGGMWRLARANVATGARELRDSLFVRGYLRQCRKYCPSLTLADLQRAPAGIRAQAVRRDGSLVSDFLFVQTRRMLHVGNAPSPAATSSIPIGREIVARLARTAR